MADKELMTGHPADGTPDGKDPAPAPAAKTEDAAPAVVDVEVGGKKYAVDPELAKALETDRKRADDRFSGLNRQVEELAALVKSKGQPEQPKSSDDLLSNTDLLFSDTEGFLRKFQSKIREEVTQELTTEYQKAEGRKQFWNKFYEVNKDLSRDDQLVIDAVMQRDYQELVNLDVGRQYEELGERVRAELLKIVGKKRDDSQPGKKPRLEGGSTPSPRVEVSENSHPKVTSISDILKAQREERMKARTGSKTA